MRFMRFNLKTWLYGIPFLQWKGWHELDCKYWWLSVNLTYKSVSITSSIRDTVTSKKLIEVFDHSAVNFMVLCTLLILSINYLIYSHHVPVRKICRQCTSTINTVYSDSFIICSFSSAINKMLYGGANLVPITVPICLLKWLFLECKYVFFNTTSA